MRHRNSLNKLSRKAAPRKAMIRNMLTSLFEKERITTTKAKAKVLQGAAEKMITRAKVDSVHNRREVFKKIKSKAVLNKLFTEIGPLFEKRSGGYTRILKLGYRKGDAAEMVIIELVEKTTDGKEEKAEKAKSTKKAVKKPAKKAEPAKSEKVEDAEIVEEEKKEEAVEASTEKASSKEDSAE